MIGLLTKRTLIFRVVWRAVNLLLAVAVVSSMYAGVREYSVRRYLDGFSDAIVPNSLPEEQKLDAILSWMRAEPSRASTANPGALAKRNPEITLTYRQLLNVCGTATNAFLNLARSSDTRARRLLLLTPDRNTKHVVAEVLIGEQWIIVDPTYQRDHEGCGGPLFDSQGPAGSSDLLRRRSAPFRIIRAITPTIILLTCGCRAVPYIGSGLRRHVELQSHPGWEQGIDWSLLLERESFFYLVLKRDSNARPLAATGRACVVRGQPIANFPLPSAQAHHACWSRLLFDAGDQTVACAAFAVSRLHRAARMPSCACARWQRTCAIAVRTKKDS